MFNANLFLFAYFGSMANCHGHRNINTEIDLRSKYLFARRSRKQFLCFNEVKNTNTEKWWIQLTSEETHMAQKLGNICREDVREKFQEQLLMRKIKIKYGIIICNMYIQLFVKTVNADKKGKTDIHILIMW